MRTVEEAICFRNHLEKFSLPRTLDGKDVFTKWPDKIGNYDQQGDALFFDYAGEIPKDAKLRLDNVAVEGLKRHVAIGEEVKVYEGYIDAPNGCTIKHSGNDHGDTILAPRRYEVKRVQEYDHIAEEQRAVID